VSNEHNGKSSLDAHEHDMKVNGLERWLFGEHGSTPLPLPRTVKTDHDDAHVSKEYAQYFKDKGSNATDDEYQRILKERTGHAGEQELVIPPGFAPVTFLEADVTLITPIGANLRELCLDNNIPLYTDLAKVLNCRGLGLCTTCRVEVTPADGVTAPTKIEKVHLLKYFPKQRLSCQCEVTGPVKVSTKPAREYGKSFDNFIRQSALFGFFSLIMLSILLVIGFDVVGKWF
jgi:ferredoxin